MTKSPTYNLNNTKFSTERTTQDKVFPNGPYTLKKNQNPYQNILLIHKEIMWL